MVDRLITPMRIIKSPVRFSNPIYNVRPRMVVLKPFLGQPRKYAVPRRLPAVQVRESTIPGAGFGVFLLNDVKEGDPISMYSQKIVSEAQAKRLKKKV